jgi:hypothetical protein
MVTVALTGLFIGRSEVRLHDGYGLDTEDMAAVLVTGAANDCIDGSVEGVQHQR